MNAMSARMRIFVVVAAVHTIAFTTLWLLTDRGRSRHGVGLEYTRRGVFFIFYDGMDWVQRAVVFRPSNPHQSLPTTGSLGVHQLVPGVGAYGVKIGDPDTALTSLRDVKFCSRFRDTSARSYRFMLCAMAPAWSAVWTCGVRLIGGSPVEYGSMMRTSANRAILCREGSTCVWTSGFYLASPLPQCSQGF